MKKTSTPKTKEATKSYKASIKLLGKTYEAIGATAKEAIESLVVGNVAKGVSVLTLSKDGRSHTKILVGPQTFRLFSASRLMREIALKQVSNLFEGL